MRLRPNRLFACLLLSIAALAGQTAPARAALPREVPTLSVAVKLGQKQVVLGSTRGFSIVDPSRNRVLRKFPAGGRVRLRSRGHGIAYGKMTLLRLVVRPASGSLLQLDGQSYRGTFEIREETGGKICVANVLDVESYLYGVVKSEMPAAAPLEAMKTQAIISRTFALKNRDNFSQRGFGLKATEESQVYSGVRGESPEARRAVDETRGVVMSYAGQLASIFYSAVCGGSTESNDVVWGGRPEPYLQPVACSYCRVYPNFHWQVDLTFDEVARKLRAAGVPVGQIQSIELQQSPSGRIRGLRIQSSRGEVIVPGNKFRMAMGHRRVKSQRFTLTRQLASAELREDFPEAAIRQIIHDYIQENLTADRTNSAGRLRIMGTGFGHGVGLCQWGAKTMAEQGQDSREILHYYFRGTRLARAY
ncbi:MAG: SpoIID/LytB domain-containing protein [Candidatus Riflebacteria bacterium]|nr:SpoIID/LytB domain-containing protein [Candidatus Riflebacteria bacterium]